MQAWLVLDQRERESVVRRPSASRCGWVGGCLAPPPQVSPAVQFNAPGSVVRFEMFGPASEAFEAPPPADRVLLRSFVADLDFMDFDLWAPASTVAWHG